MRNLLYAAYGVAAYAFSCATVVYAVGFVGGLPIPGLKTLDSGVAVPPGEAVLTDLLLLGVFALQHSVMARPAFKRAWARVVPAALERSTYVLAAAAALALLMWQWRPLPSVVWDLSGTLARPFLDSAFVAGWAVLLIATFLLDHFELFGLRQSTAPLFRWPEADGEFRTPGLYAYVRHPIYLGFVMAFWAAPVMTAGHLLFAAACTAYILLGIWFEERDLVAHFGEQYLAYRRKAGMLLPRIGRRDVARW
ncbi:methanethiol S-methyltransferase [Ramlibacter humi]|uniref:methanethiol S-methyltransferase n=1 Tax=Ramlibacter humi TaxID=2530451 RepID=A0A4Z0C846_9BURK|nr:methanethiol S-methyltransferase [Ramlibacter humi]TFZ07856.1 isoprenylcysteine carboxylmethyltransferase family protein [Ramlibacter humi]